MKVSVPYLYHVEALIGRNRVNTSHYKKYDVVEFDVPEVANAKPFLIQRKIGYDETRYYNFGGGVFSEKKDVGLRDYLPIRRSAIGGPYAANAVSDIIPDNARIVADTQEQVVESIMNVLQNLVVVNGNFALRHKNKFHLIEGYNYPALGTDDRQNNFILVGFDEVKYMEKDVYDRYDFECISEIGDIGEQDAHNSDIVLFQLMSMMKDELSTMSHEVAKKFFELRDEVVETCQHQDIDEKAARNLLKGFLNRRYDNDFLNFHKYFLGGKTGTYSLDYLLNVYEQFKNDTERYSPQIDALLTIRANINANTPVYRR